MPRVPQHAVVWSQDVGQYELTSQDDAGRSFGRDDAAAWQGWLATVDSFAFHGASGGLNLFREGRGGRGRYWYAYHTAEGRTRKQYLGATARVTLARLEEVAAMLASGPPVPDIVAEFPATKVAPPQAPLVPVERTSLRAALDGARQVSLTVVSAPAGWGKTTLLADWARCHPRRVAWLALEAADAAPVRFWMAVIAALRVCIPGAGAAALALLRAPQPPPFTAILNALINEFTDAEPPLVLVLDDYQAVAESAIDEGMAYLIDHLPAGLRLVIASRSDSPLPLARLRARGELAEFRAADLAFTATETATFLRGALAAPLADADAAMLAVRTEGWAAGVQLAALALRGQPDRAAWLVRFTGGHRFLLDYIEAEVLARQPDIVRDFLVRVAVLPRLHADLCAVVAGMAISTEILATLERDNLFIVPLDEGRRWYRLHDLFREALLARAATDPDLQSESHRRAARWHAAHGDEREAIGHALAGADFNLAAEQIARVAPALMLHGEAALLLDWLLALPDEPLALHLRLALDAALRLWTGTSGMLGAALIAARVPLVQVLDRAEAIFARSPGTAPPEEAALLRRRLRLLRALLEVMTLFGRGDTLGVAARTDEIERLGERDEARWQIAGVGLRGLLVSEARHGDVPLLPRLLAVKRRAIRDGDNLTTLRAMVFLAHEYGRVGRLAVAERECRAGLALAAQCRVPTDAPGYFHLYLGMAYYARDRLAAAVTAYAQVLAIARTWQREVMLIWAQQHLARAELARHDFAAADRALSEAEEIARREGFASFAPAVAATRALYWLATGELMRAATWAASNTADSQAVISPAEEIVVARVRVSLTREEYRRALALLEGAAAQLDRPDDVSLHIDYLALRLAALHGAGEVAASRTVATRLLALTEPEGLLRPFLDIGTPMERALAALFAAPDDPDSDNPPISRASIARLLAAFAHGRGVTAPGSAIGDALGTLTPVEMLTPREREVLRHLATGAANAEIAAALSLSPNTIKKHVGSLLGKLGAANRTQAVARARESALL